MKTIRGMVVLACVLTLAGCGGGRKTALYGCWEQTEASEAGFIRWNPAGLSEVTPKSDEVLRMTKDGSFEVYGAGRCMIRATWSIEDGKIALDLRKLMLDFTIERDTLTLTALDRKKTVYRKLRGEEEAAFLERAGISTASGPASSEDVK